MPNKNSIESEIEGILDKFATEVYKKKQHYISDYDRATKQIKNLIQREVKKGRVDPFDFVEPCEPECSKERHAYHKGQWDMATRIRDRLEELG